MNRQSQMIIFEDSNNSQVKDVTVIGSTNINASHDTNGDLNERIELTNLKPTTVYTLQLQVKYDGIYGND